MQTIMLPHWRNAAVSEVHRESVRSARSNGFLVHGLRGGTSGDRLFALSTQRFQALFQRVFEVCHRVEAAFGAAGRCIQLLLQLT
jgi:hypothetical protein